MFEIKITEDRTVTGNEKVKVKIITRRCARKENF